MVAIWAILVSAWSISKNLLLWNRMANELRLGRKHLWRSYIKITYFVQSVYKHCGYRQFLSLVGRFLKIFSETTWPNKAKFLLAGPLYNFLISSHVYINMIAMGNSCFWLVEIWKIFSSETRRHNKLLLVGMTYVKSSTKFSYFVTIWHKLI
jgi:hypothetical protein